MAFKKRRVWTSQPQEVVGVAPALRPIGAYSPGASYSKNLVSGIPDLAVTGSVLQSVGATGRVWTPDGSSGFLSCGISANQEVPFTIIAIVTPSSTTGHRQIAGFGTDASSSGSYGLRINNGFFGAFAYASGGTFRESVGAAAVAGKTYVAVGLWPSDSSRSVWVNGVQSTPETSTISVTASDNFHIGALRRSSNTGFYAGDIGDVFVIPHLISPVDLAQLRTPSDVYAYLFAPQTIWVPVSAGGGGTSLTVADAAQAHVLDNVVLTSSTALAAADMAHAHALDAVTLSTGTALTVADNLHTHALGNITLSTTGAISLTVADLLHSHALDAVVLTSQTDLVAADLAHWHALDGVTLTLGGVNLVIADIMHAHALDNVALTLDTYLAVADLLHGHTIDNVLVSIPGGTLDLILKILRNRQELNPATGTFTLYDDDGTTVLYTTSAWADAAGTVPYSGGALRRIDALF